MSRLLHKVALPALKRSTIGAPRVAANQGAKRTLIDMANNPAAGEQQQFVHARDQLVGLVGCAVVIGYASYVLAGEPAHEAAHPFYNAPYNFSKRNPEAGANWWPGRQCQFFEFNCFAQAYKEADEALAEQEKAKLQ